MIAGAERYASVFIAVCKVCKIKTALRKHEQRADGNKCEVKVSFYSDNIGSDRQRHYGVVDEVDSLIRVDLHPKARENYIYTATASGN